jgi:hypothetical protein
MRPAIYSRLQVYEVHPLIDRFPSGQGTALSILHFINRGYAVSVTGAGHTKTMGVNMQSSKPNLFFKNKLL